MKRGHRRLIKVWEPWLLVLVLCGLLVVWQFVSETGKISTLFFPSPSRIWGSLIEMVENGKLVTNLASSINRLLLGFLLGGVPGLVLGYVMGWSSRVRAFLDPLIAALHPIPKLAVFPLIMIIFGFGESSKIIAIAISAFFPMVINSMTGVRELNPVYFDVCRNYGASRWKVLTRVIIPGSLPTTLSGVRISMNMALVITIAVELLSANKGLGVIIWFAWQTFRIEELYVSLLVTALLGIGINLFLQQMTRLLAPWSKHPAEKGR